MRRPVKNRFSLAVVAALAVSATLPVAVQARGNDRPAPPVSREFAVESQRLADGLVNAVTTAGFNDLVDYSNRINGVAQRIAALPNIDVAVIELDSDGEIVGAANVLFDRDKPNGHQVQIDEGSLQASGVTFTQWRTDRWENEGSWDKGPALGDVLAGDDADVEFMVPYPASVLKVMVGYSIMRLVDAGKITLNTKHTYRRIGGSGCEVDRRKEKVADWMDEMITISSNGATCALLQLINDLGQLDAANAHFAELGLDTLRMYPAQPDVGATWLAAPARMTMGALDTAKLTLLLAGSQDQLWSDPDGDPVTEDVLSASSRDFLRGLLAEQGFHEVLSTGLLCGSPDTVAGIPALVPEQFIDRKSGHGVVDGIDFGYDVRPCNESAEVTFAHKTGLISVSGNDTGIVRALPGEDGRWYVVSIHTSVGYRFGDAAWASSTPDACSSAPFVCYPPAFARVGAAIDALIID